MGAARGAQTLSFLEMLERFHLDNGNNARVIGL